MANPSRLLIPSFAGGLWLPEGREFSIPPDGLLIANNIEYLRSGGAVGRRGILKFNSTALDGGDPIRGLWRHYPRTGTKNTLAFVDVGASVTAYKADDSSGTFSSASTGLPDDADWGFANWPAKNKTFLVSGTTTGGLRQWNGTAVSTVTASGSNQVTFTDFGPYITLHKSRLWSTDNSELNFSVYASEVNDETTWLSASQLSVNDPQGGKITGLASFFDFLLIFKETSLFRFVGDISTTLGAQLALYSDYGCIAPDSIAITPYGVIFVGRNGVYLTDGVNPNPPELSLPIRSLFVSRSSQTQYPDAVGRWYPNKQQYVLKLDPDDTHGYVLQRLEILAENVFVGERSRVVWLWSYHSNLPMISACVWDSETDDGRLLIGDSLGFVRTYDTGSDDDGSAITATLQTSSLPIDTTREPKFRTGRVRRVKLLHRADTVLSGELLYDQATPGTGSAFTIGDALLKEKFPRANINDQTLFGRFVSLWLRNPNSDADFEVHLADLETRLKEERVWRDENLSGVSTVTNDQGEVIIANAETEAVVTFANAQVNTDYDVAFGLYPSSAAAGLSTVGIKSGTKATTGFTVQVGGPPGAGEYYTVMWILSRGA